MSGEGLLEALVDATSLITLFNQRVVLKRLNALATSGEFRIPGAVAREVRRGSDRAKNWVVAHPEAVIRERDEHVQHVARVAREYRLVLTTSTKSADCVVVSMGIYFRESKTVISDDPGVSAACFSERVRVLSTAAYRRLTGL